jgi:hypothetical protein
MNEGFVTDRPEFEWLTEKSAGWQFGEQGILAALAEAIGETGQCVEIGAGNGETLPLTIDPFYGHGLPCLLFEKDELALATLQHKYQNAVCRGEYHYSLGIASPLHPRALVVVIDVDGFDGPIMRDVLKVCTPSILMVEHFDRCHSSDSCEIGDVPNWLLGQELPNGFKVQNNAATLENLARQFRYTRIGMTRVNSIFVYGPLAQKVATHVSG